MGIEAEGWQCFAADLASMAWVKSVGASAQQALTEPGLASMYDCENTWFVGLNALPNDALGRVGDGPALSGAAAHAARDLAGWPALHRAQISVTYPGYPKPRMGESDAAFSYRLRRDAAHVDGVLGVSVQPGRPKRRFVREPHRWILGVALNDARAEAAPLTVWSGSHHIMRTAFRHALEGLGDPQNVDITDTYVSARKQCFEQCTRTPVPLRAGEAVLLHPMMLHGVAPWDSAWGGMRMIAYFRPPARGVAHWLEI